MTEEETQLAVAPAVARDADRRNRHHHSKRNFSLSFG
jgi:hypothetical protein